MRGDCFGICFGTEIVSQFSVNSSKSPSMKKIMELSFGEISSSGCRLQDATFPGIIRLRKLVDDS